MNPCEKPIREISGEWYAAQTHRGNGSEKRFAAELLATSVEHYLPVVLRVSHGGGHRHIVRLPIFPGYVFFAGARTDGFSAALDAASESDYCLAVITEPRQDRLRARLQSLQQAIWADPYLDTAPNIKAQQPVRIVYRAAKPSPWAGHDGMACEMRDGPDGKFVLVALELIRGANPLVLRFDPQDVEAV